jgi:transketolase
LAMDAVQAANSGHPGTPMAMAPVVYNLWQNHIAIALFSPLAMRPRYCTPCCT